MIINIIFCKYCATHLKSSHSRRKKWNCNLQSELIIKINTEYKWNKSIKDTKLFKQWRAQNNYWIIHYILITKIINSDMVQKVFQCMQVTVVLTQSQFGRVWHSMAHFMHMEVYTLFCLSTLIICKDCFSIISNLYYY